MKPSALLAIFVVATFSTLSPAQEISAKTGAEVPLAYVYVSSDNSGEIQINGYGAYSGGALAPVPNSPISEKGSYLATDKNLLFSTDALNIYSFSVDSSGSLTQVSTINAQQYNSYPTGGPISLFTDRTGATLYDEDIYGSDGANNTYQFFTPDQKSGTLSYLGTVGDSAVWDTPLSFVGSNKYAYGSSCYLGSQTIYGFSRSSHGTLTDLDITPDIPASPDGGYCPYLAAADQANHVAISLTPTDDGFGQTGPAQLAVYNADSSGNLTTTSTSDTMPKVSVGSIYDLKASPSGKLLAVSGSEGLQVFHFNGASPITHYTGALTTNEIDQMFWDNADHLYAISRTAGELYVFTVTPAKASQSGSAYPIPGAFNIAVLPEP